MRATHWINAVLILLLSGLQTQRPSSLLLGTDFCFHHPFAAIESAQAEDGALRGRLTVAGVHLDTTGVLGASKSGGDQLQSRALPSWMTLPGYLDLGAGRRWHFAFAWVLVLNGLAYLVYAQVSRRTRAVLWPSRALTCLTLGRTTLDHLRLRFAHGEAARTTMSCRSWPMWRSSSGCCR